MRRRRAARISDIARQAGVGTATVDRVLNGRGGVSEATVQRVRRAMEAVATGQPPPTGGRDRQAEYRFQVILPADAGPSTESLGQALRRSASKNRAVVACSFVEKMNPVALAAKLDDARATKCSGIAFQALDHPVVHDAVDRIVADNIPVVALMSDLDSSGAVAFVGMDNRAAGRTAGFLMGRFAEKSGRVAVLWGGQLYRSHEEREIGFRSVIRTDYPALEILDLVSGGDDADGNYRQICTVLDRYRDLVGIYSVGGGNRGVVQALKDRNRVNDVILIGHNLTVTTQKFLIEGSMDAIIHQDMELAAKLAIGALAAQCEGQLFRMQRVPIDITTKENMQGRLRL